jgi:hypothetical protein
VEVNNLKKYDVVDCIVTGTRAYGLVVQVSEAVRGFIDSADLIDDPSERGERHKEGDVLRCVVLGRSRDGRVRLSAKKIDVEFVQAVDNPGSAFEVWVSACGDDRIGEDVARDFYQSRYARELLLWGLRHAEGARNRECALRLLPFAPLGLMD